MRQHSSDIIKDIKKDIIRNNTVVVLLKTLLKK